MSEERVVYSTGLGVLNRQENSVKLERARAGFVRVLDRKSGRFLFEFDPERDLIIWRERGQRIEVNLGEYR